MREVLRGVVVKEWVAMPNESIDFLPYNKSLVVNGLRLHIMYWNKRLNFNTNQKHRNNA